MTDSDLFSPQKNPAQKILSVSELNRLVREALEGAFPLFWIAGEISNFTRAASGHWYFSLKDSGAQVRCVMFKGRNSYVDFTPREGDQIEARCNIGFYEPRGEFQLNIEFIRKAGLGALFEAFEALKNKLNHEGLFDADTKQLIPTFARKIGIVTSPDAAALRDVLTTLNRRNPNIGVIIYPTPVQGKGVAAHIARAIQLASERNEVDTLIICRGGGSMEDLWQFNEEIVARAIAQCPIPTISGVGHETDFTICDFVADVRAATPTAAAELASYDLYSLQAYVQQTQTRLQKRMLGNLQACAQKLDYLSKRLISPAQMLQNQCAQLKQLQNRLQFAMQQQLQQYQQTILRLASGIEQLSPQAVLARGYAIVQADGKAITDSKQVSMNQQVHIVLHSGKLRATIVEKTEK